MKEVFINQENRQVESLDWGNLVRMSGPKRTGAEQLIVIEVNVDPGEGHNFHKHPQQEEVIYVISGKIEQWVDKEHKVLTAGESAFIPAGVVHASYNVGETTAKFLAILGPSVGEDGYELVEVHEEAPWDSLR